MKTDPNSNSPRAQQKQRSRDRDEERLRSGSVSKDALKRENNFFDALPIKRYKIVAIGGTPLDGK